MNLLGFPVLILSVCARCGKDFLAESTAAIEPVSLFCKECRPNNESVRQVDLRGTVQPN